MKGERRFLELTRIYPLGRDTEHGAWEDAAIPIANIKDIKDYDGAMASDLLPWKETKTIVEMKDGTRFYVKQRRAELVFDIETPYGV